MSCSWLTLPQKISISLFARTSMVSRQPDGTANRGLGLVAGTAITTMDDAVMAMRDTDLIFGYAQVLRRTCCYVSG